MRTWCFRLHRWAALLFSLPLVVVLGTGLVLSFEPWLVVGAIKPDTLSATRVEAMLARHDPDGLARSLSYRSYDGTLTISGGRGGLIVDAGSGEALPEPSPAASLLLASRRLHETLILDASGLVVASTFAMLVLAALGILMGWPRLATTLAGWHKGVAWILLPPIVLSPLSGLLMVWGVTFASAPPATTVSSGPPLRLAEAVRIVGERHDLSSLIWLRPQGRRVLARLVENGEYRVYAVTRDGTAAMPRNWPRLWHEGNFAGVWSALMNVVLSLAMIGLLVSGLWLWARRRLRIIRARRLQAASG